MRQGNPWILVVLPRISVGVLSDFKGLRARPGQNGFFSGSAVASCVSEIQSKTTAIMP